MHGAGFVFNRVPDTWNVFLATPLRLSLAIPFNAFNYLIRLTNVKLSHYAASCLDMIPGTITYCFIGISLCALAKALEVGFSKPTVLIFLIVATILQVFVYYAPNIQYIEWITGMYGPHYPVWSVNGTLWYLNESDFKNHTVPEANISHVIGLGGYTLTYNTTYSWIDARFNN